MSLYTYLAITLDSTRMMLLYQSFSPPIFRLIIVIITLITKTKIVVIIIIIILLLLWMMRFTWWYAQKSKEPQFVISVERCSINFQSIVRVMKVFGAELVMSLFTAENCSLREFQMSSKMRDLIRIYLGELSDRIWGQKAVATQCQRWWAQWLETTALTK